MYHINIKYAYNSCYLNYLLYYIISIIFVLFDLAKNQVFLNSSGLKYNLIQYNKILVIYILIIYFVYQKAFKQTFQTSFLTTQ